MHVASIHLNGKDMKGSAPMRNVLLARNSAAALRNDIRYIEGLGNVVGWIIFDEAGLVAESRNESVCLSWDARGFDDEDIHFGTRY